MTMSPFNMIIPSIPRGFIGLFVRKKKKKPPPKGRRCMHGDSNRIRTCDRWIRNPMLYPAELSSQATLLYHHHCRKSNVFPRPGYEKSRSGNGSRMTGDPNRIRTCDRRLRKPLLYPAELSGQHSHYITVSPEGIPENDNQNVSSWFDPSSARKRVASWMISSVPR